MVRSYILSPRERELLRRFVETNEKLNGFTVLIHYLKKNRDKLQEDLKLIDLALQKYLHKEEAY